MKNDSVFFSIIIPVYKVEKYLEECINSVLIQKFNNYEIILIDDGSPDKCPEICDKYISTNIHVIHKQNQGLSAARNDGINLAKGKYLIFLDSDDKFADENVLIKIENFLAKTNSEILFCPSLARFNSEYTNNFPVIKEKKHISNKSLYNYARLHRLIFCAQLFIVDTEFIKSNQLFFYEGIYHEDMEWIPRVLSSSNKISIFPERYYFYRDNPSSIVNNYNQKRFDSVCTIIDNLNQYQLANRNQSFIKLWINQNLYSLFCDMKKCKINNKDLYLKNKEKLLYYFEKNKRNLNFRNIIVLNYIKDK